MFLTFTADLRDRLASYTNSILTELVLPNSSQIATPTQAAATPTHPYSSSTAAATAESATPSSPHPHISSHSETISNSATTNNNVTSSFHSLHATTPTESSGPPFFSPESSCVTTYPNNCCMSDATRSARDGTGTDYLTSRNLEDPLQVEKLPASRCCYHVGSGGGGEDSRKLDNDNMVIITL